MPLSAGAEVLSPGPETDAVADARSKADHQLRYNTAAARHRQRRVGTLLGLWTDGLTVASCMESPLPTIPLVQASCLAYETTLLPLLPPANPQNRQNN
jgi:hypothetical protein